MSVVNPNLTLRCTGTVGAAAAAGTVVAISMRTDLLDANETTKTVPMGQEWIFEDMFIVAAADAGTSTPNIEIKKNKSRVMAMTNTLDTMLVTNNSRPNPFKDQQKIGFRQMEQITMNAITVILNDGVADALVFYIPMKVRPA